MTEDEVRRFELVRAVELNDPEALLLTREDREQADARARSLVGEPSNTKGRARFLAERAQFAAKRLTTRHAGLQKLLEPSPIARWLVVLVPLLALIAGFLANEIGTDNRLDLIALPLLGTIAWNAAVFVWTILAAFRGAGGHAQTLSALMAGTMGWRRDADDYGLSPVNRAAALFRSRWATASAGLSDARAARTMHLAAALFAAGLIGGIYLRGLVIDYRAGWESTFLSPPAVKAVLDTVLGPASALTGVPIPPLGEVAAMRWDEGNTRGVPAAPWIYLYTATMVLGIIVPRLLLAGWQAVRVWNKRRRFPHPGREDFYVRRLLRSSGAAPGQVRITPYAYSPGEETKARLTDALRQSLGERVQVHIDPPVEYGSEDVWAEARTSGPDDDFHLLLFTLSSTPEAENHGVIAKSLADGVTGMVTGALIDETPFRAHFAGQAGLDARVESRLAAWRNVLGDAGLTPLGIDLSNGAGEDLAKRIEAGLLPNAELAA